MAYRRPAANLHDKHPAHEECAEHEHTASHIRPDGIDDPHTGVNNTDNDGTDLAMEAESGAEVAGSESRADVAPKDGSVGVVAAAEDGI